MIRFLAACLFLCSFVHAQPPPVTTRILTYAPDGLPDSFETYYRAGEEIMLFRASAGTLGLPVTYIGPRLFALYGSREDLAPPPPGQAPKPPLATVTLPENADNVLILCQVPPDGKARLIAYDISSSQLKAGDYRVFNFSRASLSLILDSQKLALTPGNDAMLRDSSWHDEVKAFPIQIATITGGKPKLVYSTFWEHYPQRRGLLFLFDGRHPSMPVTFTSMFVDIPPAEKPEN